MISISRIPLRVTTPPFTGTGLGSPLDIDEASITDKGAMPAADREFLSLVNEPEGPIASDENGEVPFIWLPQHNTTSGWASAVPRLHEIVTNNENGIARRGDGVTAGGLDFVLNSSSCVYVTPRSTIALSGLALVAAYARAKLLTPGGSAISATNPAYLLVAPGVYDLANNAAAGLLNLDTAGLHVIGLGGSDVCKILGQEHATDTGHIRITADNVTLQGFTLQSVTSAATGIISWFATASSGIVHRDIRFNGFSATLNHAVEFDASVTAFGGLYERIRSNCQRTYGGPAFTTCNATFRDMDLRLSTSNIGLHCGAGALAWSGLMERVWMHGNWNAYVTGRITQSRLRAGTGTTPCMRVGAGAIIDHNILINISTGLILDISGVETPTISAFFNTLRPRSSDSVAYHASIVNNINTPLDVLDLDLPTSV